MGLDTSHDCWHGAYSSFMHWRCAIAKAAGLPPLGLMEGFYNWAEITKEDVSNAVDKLGFDRETRWASEMLQALYGGGNLPIKWECLRPSPLNILLRHSDCDGEILAADCASIADALEAVLPLLPSGKGPGHIGFWSDKTKAFIEGLRLAANEGENVSFH